MAELAGSEQGDIWKAGQWQNHLMESCYLTGRPHAVMRSLAGFDKNVGTLFLPRDVNVPDALLPKVFPEVDGW